MQVLIMCKSLTKAQRASLLLERRGIGAAVVKAPQALRQNGCGYAVSLYRHIPEAIAILKSNGLSGERILQRESNGNYIEVKEYDLS